MDLDGHTRMTITALHIASRIDVYGFVRALSAKMDVPHVLQRNHVVFELHSPSSFASDSQVSTAPEYAVFYDFGAAVFFNHSKDSVHELVQHMLLEAEGSCHRFIQEPKHQEQYAVVERSDMAEWSAIGENCIEVQKLDIHNIRVISGVLGPWPPTHTHTPHTHTHTHTPHPPPNPCLSSASGARALGPTFRAR